MTGTTEFGVWTKDGEEERVATSQEEVVQLKWQGFKPATSTGSSGGARRGRSTTASADSA